MGGEIDLGAIMILVGMPIVGIGHIGVLAVIGLDAGIEADGLLFELGHHFRAGDTLRKTGVVFYIGGGHQLPAGEHEGRLLLGAASEDQWFQVSPGGVDGGGPGGGS